MSQETETLSHEDKVLGLLREACGALSQIANSLAEISTELERMNDLNVQLYAAEIGLTKAAR